MWAETDASRSQNELNVGKLLLEEAVEQARRRVEERVAHLVEARMGVRRRAKPNTNADKKREYALLRASGRLS
jgi:hypothetical protein